MSPPRAPCTHRPGFSLVEAIAAISVIAALGSISSTLLYSAVQSYQDATIRAQLQAEGSTSLDRLMRAVSSIGRNTSATVVAPNVSSVTATSIAFNGNWSLTLSGTQVLLSENGGAALPVMNNVSALAVSIYDESNAAIALPCSGAPTQTIRRIQIQVTLTRNGIAETLRSRMFIRTTMSGAAVGA